MEARGAPQATSANRQCYGTIGLGDSLLEGTDEEVEVGFEKGDHFGKEHDAIGGA